MSQSQPTEPAEAPDIRVLPINVDGGETIYIDFGDFPSPTDPTYSAQVFEIVEILERENAPAGLWVRLIEEVWRFGKYNLAMEILKAGLDCKFEVY